MKRDRWNDYFSGAMPAGEYFSLTLNNLWEILNSSPKNDILNEICFVGLISYFEGFCKDHFASIINIIPELIEELKGAKQDVSIESTSILLYREQISNNIGFLLSEKYDFGSAKEINSLFKSLLKVTPFSKKDIKIYNGILRDRNLVVHHGGIYTLTYLQQSKIVTEKGKGRAYFDSIDIDEAYMIDIMEFIEKIAKKMIQSSNVAVKRFITEKKIAVNNNQLTAIDNLLMWD